MGQGRRTAVCWAPAHGPAATAELHRGVRAAQLAVRRRRCGQSGVQGGFVKTWRGGPPPAELAPHNLRLHA